MNTIKTCAALAALVPSALAMATADVRVVHASPDAPNVDVLVNGGIAFSNLPFTGVTGYATLPSDNYNFQVVPAGAAAPVVIDADAFLESGLTYTVAAVNTLDSIAPLILVDDNTINPNARVRFAHLSPNAPAVDIAVAGGPVLFGNISYLGVGDYLGVAPGVYDLEVRLAGTDTVVLSVDGVELSGRTVYSVFAMGLVGDENAPLQAVLSVDAVPTPGAAALIGLGALALGRRRR
ncbi:MAG: DUF4397 domain-containing protein [Phycisphaerales bacterium]|nr:MAG: DUF4397 domain-containing protein [Phycisphaerales bacterium]